MTDRMRARLDATGLHHLPRVKFTHIDAPLIAAFIKQWQCDTNNFHLPLGEMTIMLHDIFQILRILIEGHMVIAQSSMDDLRHAVAELLVVDVREMYKDY